ncbi:NUDIX domain-containing protein [Patescibacteria group bacterium]
MTSTNNRFKMIGSSYLFLVKKNKILLSRRFQTGYEDGKYSLPAGHVEEEETLTENLVREVKEEVGLDIKKYDAKLAHVMHRRHNDIRVDYFFTVSKWVGNPKNCEPDKCDDVSWFPINKLPENTVVYIRHAIECWQKGIIYSEFGWG